MLGKTVSHYRVLRKLGEGGMGVVYEAEDENLPRRVALKFCSAAQDPQLRPSLLREAHALCSLKHPNIAEVYELGQTGEGEPFIVMELLPDGLSGRLRNGRPAIRETRRVVAAIAMASEHAHNKGILHRDIKPSNVRMTETGQVKVTDFGLAAAVYGAAVVSQQSTIPTAKEQAVGTPGFMAPEVIRREAADRRSDLFSLGCLLYEMLTGKAAFPGKTHGEIYENTLKSEPAPPSSSNPAAGPALDRVTLKLLEKRPEDRYQSAGEVVAALEALDSPVVVWRSWLDGRRRMLVYGVAVWMVGFLAVFLWNRLRVHVVPQQARYWYDRGIASIAEGSYFNATKQLTEAVKSDPDFSMARAHLAEAWDEIEYSELAKEALLQATRGPPSL